MATKLESGLNFSGGWRRKGKGRSRLEWEMKTLEKSRWTSNEFGCWYCVAVLERCGFEQEDIDQLLEAIPTNYRAWCSGFAPLVVGGDMESAAVQEFSWMLFNMRPDIALCVARTVFQISDMRPLLGLVTVPCHLIQSMKDMAVPVEVAAYMQQNLGGESVVEIVETEGHLPQLSSPDIVIQVLLRHIQYDIAV